MPIVASTPELVTHLAEAHQRFEGILKAVDGLILEDAQQVPVAMAILRMAEVGLLHLKAVGA